MTDREEMAHKDTNEEEEKYLETEAISFDEAMILSMRGENELEETPRTPMKSHRVSEMDKSQAKI